MHHEAFLEVLHVVPQVDQLPDPVVEREEALAKLLALIGRAGPDGRAILEDHLGLGEEAAERGAGAEQDEGRVGDAARQDQLRVPQERLRPSPRQHLVAGMPDPSAAQRLDGSRVQIGERGLRADLGREVGTGLVEDPTEHVGRHRDQVFPGPHPVGPLYRDRQADRPGRHGEDDDPAAGMPDLAGIDAEPEPLDQPGLGALQGSPALLVIQERR
jgi:hypothetical protein